MSKLMFANLSRMIKDKAFWLCNIFMILAGVYVAFMGSKKLPLEKVAFIYVLLIGLVSSVFCSMYLGTEHSDGTLRNKIIAGHTKTAIYLANLLISMISGLIFCFAFIVPNLIIGILRIGFFEEKMSTILFYYSITLFISIAFSSIFNLMSMLIRNKSVIAVISIVSFIALLTISSRLNMRLQEPPMQDSFLMSANGVDQVNEVPNPCYVSGTKREIYQFILDFLPSGQAVQFIRMKMIHSWLFPIYSFLVVLLTSGIGVVVFRKEDIN